MKNIILLLLALMIVVNAQAIDCKNEIQACTQLCHSAFSKNTCDPNTLVSECICQDGSKPDTKAVSSLSSNVQCLAALQVCVGKCPQGSNPCTDNCNKQNKCQSQPPTATKPLNSTHTTATATPTATNIRGKVDHSSAIMTSVWTGYFFIVSVLILFL